MQFHEISSLVLLVSVLLENVSGQTVCPVVRTTSGWLDLFPLPCKKNADCIGVMGAQYLCCKGFCTKGVKAASVRSKEQKKKNRVELSSTSTSTSTTTTTTTTTTTPSTTSSTTTTTTTTEAPRPFLQILPIQTLPTVQKKNSGNKAGKSQKYICPKSGQVPVILFPIPCENNGQCRSSSGPDHVCCNNRCVKGVPAPKPASQPKHHQPLLGVIPRECPSTPLGEFLFEVQTCKSDADCWPRLCCPDGKNSYCRTARARLDLVPIANQIDGPVRMFEKYLQCTPAPQYDAFPKVCSSSVDCFPNLCCAEGGKKHCRPPQRSVLALLAGVGQRAGSAFNNLRQSQATTNKIN